MPKLNYPWERYGLIAHLAQSYQDNHAHLGKTALQKVIYFLQEGEGVKCGYDFRLHTYGPFSPAILSDLDVLDGLAGVSVVYDATVGGYEIKPGKRASDFEQKAAGFLESNRSAINNVLKTFSQLNARELELRSTIFFVEKEMLKSAATVNQESLLEIVHDVKPHFDYEMILQAITELKEAGYVKPTIT